jgi:hypothetical protein
MPRIGGRWLAGARFSFFGTPLAPFLPILASGDHTMSLTQVFD